MDRNLLFYGDNLDVLREHVPDESVDLVYLDPPFNSNRSYNVLFENRSGDEAQAQIEAFDDTWTWSQDSEAAYDDLVGGGAPAKVADAIEAMRRLLGDSDVLAYLVMMTPRLVELHRVLKPTGSLWIHCDPTASHYLKILLDAVFAPELFANEIVWQRTAAKGLSTVRLPNNHDILLCYHRSDASRMNVGALSVPYDESALDEKTAAKYSLVSEDGRRYQLTSLINPNPDRPNLTYEFLGVTKTWRWTHERMQREYEAGRVVQTAPGRVPRYVRYLDEQRGKPMGDVWADIPPINARASERLGYPTQKPEALLERIIAASSNEGDVVLDPFCGCGTTVAVAQRLRRRWIGIDITYLAVDLISKRLIDTYGEDVADTFEVYGIPRDLAGARALFERDPFDFERWAVSLVGGQPNLRQVGDKGADGMIRFPLDGQKAIGRVVVSVKGGERLGPAMVRDLVGTVESQRAQMGLLITLAEPTRGMIDAARHSGTFMWELTGRTFPRVQLVTVADLLGGERPELPAAFLPYVKARRAAVGDQGTLDL